MAPEIDESQWPLLMVKMQGAPSDQEFADYLERMGTLVGRGQPTALVIDASRAEAASAKQRRAQAEWMRAHDAALRKYSMGIAFVLSSPMMRGVLTAILWLQPLPVPHVVVSTRAEAVRWARERLAERGISAA